MNFNPASTYILEGLEPNIGMFGLDPKPPKNMRNVLKTEIKESRYPSQNTKAVIPYSFKSSMSDYLRFLKVR